MPVTIKIPAGKLGASLRHRKADLQRALLRGSHRGAHRARALMVAKTPVDTGQLRASWKVKKGSVSGTRRKAVLAELINDAPHAGIVEKGARPHKVNRAGIKALTAWAWRHFPGADPKFIRRIVWGVVKKLRTKGQKPTHFVKNNRKEAERMLRVEVEKEVARAARRQR